MAGQERKHGGQGSHDEEQVPEAAPAESKAVNDDDLDALLEDIDEALEANAESFVRQFQQKGGQ